jgi:flavin reductase (DIM6/NTAB) family NADH-FMN oxidoreductase RutF
MLLDYSELNSTNIYKLMSQTIIPRPIAWIVTQNSQGVFNIAPFSYFTPLSSSPATVIVSIGHKSDGEPKDTLANIRNSKKATICFVDERDLEDMKNSALELAHHESEIEKFNIKTENILNEYPPIVKDVQSAMFCEFKQTIDIEGATVPVILEVKSQYIDDSRVVDSEKLYLNIENISRIGKEFAITQELS